MNKNPQNYTPIPCEMLPTTRNFVCYTIPMRPRIENSKVFPYVAGVAIILFLYFAYHLFMNVDNASSPIGEKINEKKELIDSVGAKPKKP
jgi:hypothetical protein